MRAGFVHFFVAVSSMFLGAACGPPAKRSKPLTEAMQTYNEGIRWERFTTAAAHIPPEERAEFLDERDSLSKSLHILSYDLVRVDMDPARTAAQVVVKYEWYDDREAMLRETHVTQRWQQREGRWWLTSERATKGPSMPGVLDDDGDDTAAKDPKGDPADVSEDPGDRAEGAPDGAAAGTTGDAHAHRPR